MINVIFKILIIFFSIQSVALCEEENTESITDQQGIDFSKLANPFLSQLPKEEISKTPVELPKQTVNNVFNVIKMPELPVALPTIEIQGIVYGVKDPQVIINDEAYGIGDRVMGTTIKSITKKGVKFFYSGREFNVNLDK